MSLGGFMYNFDKVIDRKGTSCIKHDGYKMFGKSDDMISLWVADMDFETAPEIIEALKERAGHGIFGYSMADREYFDAVYGWYKNRFNYEIKEEWLITSPGIVFALNNIIRALTNEGDAILIQRPVYYPFSNAINQNKRTLINAPLTYKNNKYSIDFAEFEKQIVDNNVKMFILCSPHNPVCRVWTLDELTKMGDICLKHGVIVVADEIHSDFVHKGKHVMFAAIKKEFEDICVTCTSPSKTFNIAGLQISNLFISNKEIREKVEAAFSVSGYGEPNIFGLTAVIAAYTKGEPWMDAMLHYVRNNIKKMREYLSEHLPKVVMIETEGTYLVWLDFSAYGFTEEQLEEVVQHKAKLWLDGGTMFGPEGLGFQRVNMTSSWSVLEKALENLKSVL